MSMKAGSPAPAFTPAQTWGQGEAEACGGGAESGLADSGIITLYG
jgi:hypothetical protein